MELEASLDWLSLSMTPGLGSRLTGKLLRHFGSPANVFRASLTQLEACQLPSMPARAIHAKQAHKEAEEELSRARTLGCRLLNWDEPEYPQRLLEIYDPPPLLYVRGDAGVLNRHSISMVGTRRPTPYGNQVAEKLGHDLAAHGLGIVSGMARGIDTSAERTRLFEESLSPQAKTIFNLLGTDETIHIDELVERAELNSSEVLAALCQMEMQGMVRQMPGKQFLKILL